MAPEAKPRSRRSSETFAAVRLVRANTIVRPRPLCLQDAREHLDLVHRVRAVDELLGGLDGGADVVGLGGADVRRLRHVAARERDDGAGHRRREEHRVARRGGRGEQLLDVGEEAKVEHLVGLVEHHGADVAQVEVALVDEVDHAAGRADDDVDAVLEASICGSYARPP